MKHIPNFAYCQEGFCRNFGQADKFWKFNKIPSLKIPSTLLRVIPVHGK